MKKLVLTTALVLSLICFAQDRTNGEPAQLAWKSKEINNALWWTQNPANGKWENRKCSKMVYLGEGIKVDNFYALFIGEYVGHKYLFVDKRDYFWRYPTTEVEWMYSRTMYGLELSDDVYSLLQNLPEGEIVSITPISINHLRKSDESYSFPFFLELTETMRSVADKPNSTPFMVVKRSKGSKGKDVVRFRLDMLTELIDDSYFEVDYTTFLTLFVNDTKITYK